jgi:hypothetical protein
VDILVGHLKGVVARHSLYDRSRARVKKQRTNKIGIAFSATVFQPG